MRKIIILSLTFVLFFATSAFDGIFTNYSDYIKRQVAYYSMNEDRIDRIINDELTTDESTINQVSKTLSQNLESASESIFSVGCLTGTTFVSYATAVVIEGSYSNGYGTYTILTTAEKACATNSMYLYIDGTLTNQTFSKNSNYSLENHGVLAYTVIISGLTEELPIATIASEKVEEYETVFTISNPIDHLKYARTVSMGISNHVYYNYSGYSAYNYFIKTDASSNDKSNGGILVNTSGEVVGIIVTKISQSSTNSYDIDNFTICLDIQVIMN